VLAKQLGCKLPYSIAKKLNCRCGKVFVYPDKFLSHRAVCEVLHVRDKEIVDRKPIEQIEVIKIKKVKHQLFTCIGCGFEFHKKSHLKHHKQLCTAFAILDAIRIRGEEYLVRHKKEEKHGKRKGKKLSKLHRQVTSRSKD
jgi:hypothetical protein